MSSRGRGRVSTQYSCVHKIQQFPWLHKVFRKFWRLNEKCKSCCCWAAFLTKSDWMLREFMEGDKAVSSDLWLHPCLFNPSNIFLTHLRKKYWEYFKIICRKQHLLKSLKTLLPFLLFYLLLLSFSFFLCSSAGGMFAEVHRVSSSIESTFAFFILYSLNVFVYFLYFKFFSLCFKVFLFCVFSFFFVFIRERMFAEVHRVHSSIKCFSFWWSAPRVRGFSPPIKTQNIAQKGKK